MSKKNFITSLFVSSALALNGCAAIIEQVRTDAVSAKGKAEAYISPRHWYKASTGYAKHIAPYVADDKGFTNFMNKYKTPRRLSEQEKLEAIVQLGIYKHKPEWLPRALKTKLDKLAKKQRVRTGLNAGHPILLAANEVTFPSCGSTTSDLYPGAYQIAQLAPPVAPPLIAWDLVVLTAGITTYTLAHIQLSAPTLGQINPLLTAATQNALEQEKDAACKTGGCKPVEIPQDQIVLIPDRNSTGQWNQGGGNCTPDEQNILQAQVDLACSIPRSCTKGRGQIDFQLNPATAAHNISTAMACIIARQKINNLCFMGGDNRHKRAINDERKAISNCQQVINSGPR